MRFISIAALSVLLLTAGCGEQHAEQMAVPEMQTASEEADAQAASDFAAEILDGKEADSAADEAAEASEAAAESQAVPSADIKISVPQIAYTYRYGFRIAADEIAPLQSAHAKLCEEKGPSVCRILNLSQSGGEGAYSHASLKIEIAAAQARSFGEELANLAEKKGGKPIDTSITGEDLSKAIVDTEARLRARILLRDRLMEILRSRSGSVAELVEAERGVAKVNEEIDQAQSWLAEMKGRVAFSKMNISYNSGAPSAGSFLGPIQQILSRTGEILGTTIAFMIGAVIFLLPWALILWLVLWSRKRHGWRFRFWRHEEAVKPENSAEE